MGRSKAKGMLSSFWLMEKRDERERSKRRMVWRKIKTESQGKEYRKRRTSETMVVYKRKRRDGGKEGGEAQFNRRRGAVAT